MFYEARELKRELAGWGSTFRWFTAACCRLVVVVLVVVAAVDVDKPTLTACLTAWLPGCLSVWAWPRSVWQRWEHLPFAWEWHLWPRTVPYQMNFCLQLFLPIFSTLCLVFLFIFFFLLAFFIDKLVANLIGKNCRSQKWEITSYF